MQQLASALIHLSAIHPVRYVFFPLEAEANTGADLHAAYELARHLRPEMGFRIWHELPGIDAILRLLRMSGAAITIRLHAAIFALSQNIPVVAIDYHMGGRGKVGQLFDDLGCGSSAINIAELEPAQIMRVLIDMANSNRPANSPRSAHEE